MQPEKLLGKVIDDRYELISQLGKGRSGIVFKAKHRQLKRVVAVKVLTRDPTEDEHAIARFEREARSAAFLHHPNIVTIYDLGIVPEEYAYIVMEFVEGMDLGHVLGTDGRLPVGRTVRICSQICSALSHAHNKGVIHRDLKPTNVMLQDLEDYPDFAKIVDFGLAKRVSSEGDTGETLTMDGQVFGTPAYMSPEQCQGQKLDGRCDIYALGCLCFKMLTGAMPITGMSIVEIMQAHVHSQPHTFETAYPTGDIPVALQTLVYKALDKDPSKRPQSMAEFRHDLLAAISSAASATPGLSFAAPVAADQTTQARLLAGLEQSAQMGNPQSQYELSLKLENGDGVPLDKEAASLWLNKSAQAGYPQAQCVLAQKFLTGQGCELDASKAVFWYLKSAQQGNEQAAWHLANCYEKGEGTNRNLAEAILWYKFLLGRGQRRGEERLAACYVSCLKEGIAADGLVEWVKTSADAGDAETLYLLSSVLQQAGHEEKEDILNALSSAAQFGHEQAQYELGLALLEGELMPRNDHEGVRWLKSAAAAGNLQAMTALAGCMSSGIGTPRDQTEANNLVQRSAEAGCQCAKALLGCMILTGDGAPRNIVRGSSLLKEAAESGDSFAQWKLALCHKSGIGAVRDAKKCDQWFAKSAAGNFDQGPPWQWSSSQLRCEEAFEYFQSAAAAGNSNALFWLGIAYEHGFGIKKDTARALDCFRTAAQRGSSEAQRHAATLQKAIGSQRR